MSRRQAETVELPERLEAFRSALDLAEGRLNGDAIAFGRQVDSKATERLRHGTTHTLVALLGATGSGKSSVTNAIVGSDIATTGVRRPTTSSTLACVFGPDDAHGLLDWLEVANRHLVPDTDRLSGLVLLDVPDHDSVAVSHRLEMERIAEHADLLLWVTDSEKYADKAMHTYLRTLSHHGAVTVMVLNKTDQLVGDEVEIMTNDLERLLTDDGLATPTVIPLSATTGDGVEQLLTRLAGAVEEQRMMIERLSADITTAVTELQTGAGDGTSAEVTKRISGRLADDLVAATGLEVVTDAVAAGHRRDAASAMGWPFTRWLRKLRPHPLRKLHLGDDSAGRTSLPAPSGAQQARALAAIRDAADDVAGDLPAPWPGLVRDAALPNEEVLRDRLDRAIGDAVRNHRSRTPRWWSLVGVLQVLLAAAVLVGFVWLAALVIMGYLQIPVPDTPKYRGVPIPTGLLVLGALLGWLLAIVARQLAGIGAKRRARQARKAAALEVEAVADELVLEPMRLELAKRDELLGSLQVAADR